MTETTKVKHTPLDKLFERQTELSKNSSFPKHGQTYKHYKGTLYTVQMVAMTEESEEPVVVYNSLSHPELWCWTRPLSSWNETVTIDGKTVPRFEFWTECPTLYCS